MQNKIGFYCIYISLFLLLHSCSAIRPLLPGNKESHHTDEKKTKETKEAGPGEAWIKAATATLNDPLDIILPYSENGYLAVGHASTTAFRFSAKRGQKLKIILRRKTPPGFTMQMDLWQSRENMPPKFLSSTDTASMQIEYAVNEDTMFIVRIQPQLLKEAEYSLTISPGPSLAFPIPQNIKSSILSFWGDGRDNGGRKHEGIDILAPKHSPAIACANGTITRVEENALGGKVVYLRPDNANYSLYYAHLDSQIAVVDQRVKTGDILGLTGNTGNAKFTVSHLHFGIYTNKGAIDPLYFVKKDYKDPVAPIGVLSHLNFLFRNGKGARLFKDQQGGNFITLDENTLLKAEAIAGNAYRVVLADGTRGFISMASVTSTSKPIRRITVKKALPLLANPDNSAAHEKMLVTGDKINILAAFKDFYFVSSGDLEGWIAKDEL